MKKITFKTVVLGVACLPFLSGCAEVAGFKLATAGLMAVSHGVFSNPDVNLKEKNFAAADFLAGQMKAYIDIHDYIRVFPLEELDNAGISSPLGKAIPEGIGLRFHELGYRVDMARVVAGGKAGIYAAPSSPINADFVLKGNYLVHDGQVDVYLRVFDARNGQVVGQFDYVMPLSSELNKLSQTEAKIFVVE